MKAAISVLCLLFSVTYAGAQMTHGLTGKKDTSYTNQSAFKSAVKKYPYIKLVREQTLPEVKEKRDIIYCSREDRNLYLDAFYPEAKGNKPVPAILIIHGGGWRSGSRAQHIPLAQRLAARGYVCFTAEYRLSTEALYPAAVKDLKAAVCWIRSHAPEYNADALKIAALGFSAGGELGAFIGTTNNKRQFESLCSLGESDAVQAVIDIDGTLSFVHPESGEGDDTRSTSAATYWFGYSKEDKPDLWKEASPLTHAGKDTPPFLFINSSVDRMHAGRDDFRSILDQHGIYSEVHTFPDSPHSFCLFEPWFDPTVDYISAFLEKVFK
ncbi:alpha/beta hydrolase [Arcticibacter tournemirensis]